MAGFNLVLYAQFQDLINVPWTTETTHNREKWRNCMVKARFANFNSFFYHTLFYYIKMKNVLRTIGINLLFELLFISLGTHSFSRNAKSPWARRFNYVFFFFC